jgi:hypothetical protein
MAVVQGIREKVHLPLYDSLSIKPKDQLFAEEKSGTLKFFVNVQGKTKLETNLQSASLLPHYNTFEARAMRVVISDLPPAFPDDDKDSKKLAKAEDLDVQTDAGLPIDATGNVLAAGTPGVTADIEITIDQLVQLYRDAKDSDTGDATLPADDDSVTLFAPGGGAEITNQNDIDNIAGAGDVIVTMDDIQQMLDDLKQDAPPQEQLDPNNGSGTVIGKLVYNTVTSLFVGEKVMISMPTWFFPAGAGPYSETGKFTTHGQPSPNATFRFAEPIYIDKQQNFRVEIEVPDSDTLKDIQRIYGPMNIWVVLDGYMTRDVQ